MRQMASDLEQLKAQMKVMVQLMATLAEPTSHENKKILQQKNDNQSQAQIRKFDPLPVSPSQLLPGLVAAGLLTPIPLRVTAGSLSKGFDPEVRCDFHMGSPGHDTNKCHSLRHAIQNLIDKHLLNFQRSKGSTSFPFKSKFSEFEDSGLISIGKAIPYKKRRFDPSLFITPPRTKMSLRLEGRASLKVK